MSSNRATADNERSLKSRNHDNAIPFMNRADITPSIDENTALLVIDVQEDFCPPHGALAVTNGRDVAPIINRLLKLPFKLKIATQDYHPRDHISFASQHAPFSSPLATYNPIPEDPSNPERIDITLWPDHCVQGTPGCKFIPELDISSINHLVRKGMDRRVEAYSGFGPSFRKPWVARTNLVELLADNHIRRVFVCGLALDYCVKCTAMDAAAGRMETFVVEDACKAVNQSEEGLDYTKREMAQSGVKYVNSSEIL